MPTLHDFQKDFLEKISSDDAQGALRIYKNNKDLILRDVLKGVFPVTTILLGDAFMHQAAHEFIKTFPPDSGDMNGYGGDFPAFLGHIPALRRYPYVPDVAKLEWLAHESYLSPVRPPLTAEDLAAEKDPLNMKLHLQPHVFLLRSGWPVDKLWARITKEGKDLKDFALKPEETFVAVYREEKQVAVWSLNEGGWKFLEYLQSDPSLAFAAEAALRAEPSLPLDLFLAQGVQAGIFCTL